MGRKYKIGLWAVAALGFVFLFFHWTVNRVYVPEGKSLRLRYKGPLLFGERHMAKPGMWAKDGEIGVREKMVGPGRHFYCPLWWERELVDDVVIAPGQVGVVTCQLGDSLPAGQFLVDGEIGETEFKGVLRKVLGPGRYRINTYGYEVKVVATETTDHGQGVKKHSGWVSIPTGYVGVVTNLADNPHTKQTAGIQDKVLPPGLYRMNPREQSVDVVEVGYHETTINITSNVPTAKLVEADEKGEVVDAVLTGGISFPSSDGFKITMDFTAVWGLMPNQAPNAIRQFGNLDLVEKKVVLPQIESLCRNNGSKYPAVKLLVGKEREEFQDTTLAEFTKALNDKEISIQSGLVRHIYIPREVRQPIMVAYIADELRLTRDEEQKTAKAESELREAERKVLLATATVKANTTKLVAERQAEGDKVVGETVATTNKLTAAFERQTAEADAESKLVLGKADSDGRILIETAKSNRFKLAVDAFRTPNAFNNFTFANNLPDDLKLKLFYAGQGTLWTDLNGSKFNLTLPPAKQDDKK